MSWDFKTLEQMGSISRGRSKHRPRNDSRLFGGSYPFIQTADVKDANFYITKYSQTYNEMGLKQSKLWDKGTLCITIAANIADTAILDIPTCFPDSIMGFNAYDNVANTKFVKYNFDILQKKCKQISQGTAQDNLSWEKLSTIKFPCPSINIQNRIVNILSRYDELIENYQKQIQLLEEAAQRIYKEWFINFRFPGHENVKVVDGVPEGWKKKCVGDCLLTHFNGGWGKEDYVGSYSFAGRVIRGTDIEKLRNGNFGEIPLRYHTEHDITNKKIMANDIIIELSNGNINNVGRTLFLDNSILSQYKEKVICASFCKLLRPLNRFYALILYCEMQDLQNSNRMFKYKKNGANGINNFDFKGLLKHEIISPNNKEMAEPLSKLLEVISNKRVQIDLLTEARDRLLPKLMSGEIEV